MNITEREQDGIAIFVLEGSPVETRDITQNGDAKGVEAEMSATASSWGVATGG